MSDLQMVRVGETQLAYHVSGLPQSPPLVLLHALGQRGETWDAVAAALSPSWRVYALDLRGHGRSDWPGVYSFELMRDDVVGFLKALGLEHVTLVGHSMGGVAAYLVAEDHPAMVNRLVLEEPAPPFAATPPREVPDRPEEPVPFDWAVISAVTAQRNDPDPAWWDRLTEITAPTLVIGGGTTSHMPQDQLAAIAGRIPQGQMATIPVGHEVHAAQSAEFIAEITAFLDSTG